MFGKRPDLLREFLATFSKREGVKKKNEKAVRLRLGSSPSSLTETICENFGPIFPIMKW